jgi:hypothetical protein
MDFSRVRSGVNYQPWVSVFNLCNAVVGAGVLSFPYAFRLRFLLLILAISCSCKLCDEKDFRVEKGSVRYGVAFASLPEVIFVYEALDSVHTSSISVFTAISVIIII